jgi:hypothetical protein
MTHGSPCPRIVQKVKGFVGIVAHGQEPVAQIQNRLQSLRRVGDAVMALVFAFHLLQNLQHRLVGRLLNGHHFKSASQGSVRFNVLDILLPRGCADAADFP